MAEDWGLAENPRRDATDASDDYDDEGDCSFRGTPDDDYELDWFDEALQDCSMHEDGQCGAAGSEYCDWECPIMKLGWFDVEDEPEE